MFYNSSNNYEFNDCISHGVCSVSPNITSMQEVMFVLLRQISYYLVKLRNFDVVKNDIAMDVVKELASADAAKDLSEVQLLNSFSKEYNNLVRTRKEYLKICKDNNVSCTDLRHLIKLSPKTSLSSILKMGDKEFMHKYKKLAPNQKYLAEILSATLKSVCVNLVALKDLDMVFEPALNAVLDAMDIFNKTRIFSESIKKNIETLASFDIELLKLISEAKTENFGDIEETTVSYSTRPGKAVMVSGSNYTDLKNVLNAVKDMDIDVYTNGNLLAAHAFSYFKQFKNLKGHFGSGIFNTILDFATFPGAILLTKNEAQNIEYLYRGRLFTTDDIAPKGVVKIENNNFTPLIESALQAKGFAKGQNRNSEIVGYDGKKLSDAIDNIMSKNPEKVLVIGHSNPSINQNDYFKMFYSLLPEDCFVITFSYNPHLDNVLFLNLGSDYSLFYNVLNKIFEKIPVEKLVFFLTRCDVNSLSNIINLKSRGVENIFLSDCPPFVINPAVFRAFSDLFKIHKITTPKADFALLKIIKRGT